MSLDPTLPRRARLLVPRLPRIPARALLAFVLTVLVLGAGWMWFRDSSFARVKEVTVTGASTSEQAKVRAALENAALDQTTLHVRADSLRAAVASFDSVADIRVHADFPHRMRIEVLEHKPVAALEIGDTTLAATGSGLILRGVSADEELPIVKMDAPPAGDRVDNDNTKAALAISAAAPDELRRRIDRLWTGPKGMMLALIDGPDVVFGDASDAGRKWLAATRVLADQSAAGATYLDVRIPERVAAGGLGPVPEATPEASPGATPGIAPEITPEANPQP
jgi:cell division protein FtsQ